MSVIQALLIHSSDVHTGEITGISILVLLKILKREDDPLIIPPYHVLVIITEQFQNTWNKNLPLIKLTGFQQLMDSPVPRTRLTLVWNKAPEAHLVPVLAFQHHYTDTLLFNCCTTCYDTQPFW